MQDFRNLKVWEKAHTLTLDVYATSRAFPREEIYGLNSQVRRAAASIRGNIAEGCCRKGDAELGRFHFEFLQTAEYERLTGEVVEIKRMLAALISKLKADS